MNCAFDKEKLSGYYDGELDAAEKAEVERHIASCSECLRELGELKSAAILVKELPRLRAPRSIAEGVRKEIQAAGKVHSFAKARRTTMWVATAAAVLFIAVNVVYFASPSKSPESAVAAKPTSAAPALGRALPADDPAAPAEARRKAVVEEQAAQKDRVDEARKNESLDRDRKLDAAPVVRAEAERAKKPEAAPKIEEKKPTAAAEPPAPAAPPAAEAPKPAAKPALAPAPARPREPAAPATTAAPSPVPDPKPAEPAASVDKATAKKEADGQAALKQKAAEAPAADAGPTHLTLATTQLAKSRQDIAEVLKKMGITMPPPPSAAMVKGVARSGAREETVNQFELTDAQIARLRAEMDKPGSSMLMTAKPEDPVMAQFKRGGIYEAKKDVASGGAAPAKKFGDSKTDAPTAKEAEDSPAGAKAFAVEGAPAEKAGEPRRKVVLHFLEVPYVPDRQPASDAIKK